MRWQKYKCYNGKLNFLWSFLLVCSTHSIFTNSSPVSSSLHPIYAFSPLFLLIRFCSYALQQLPLSLHVNAEASVAHLLWALPAPFGLYLPALCGARLLALGPGFPFWCLLECVFWVWHCQILHLKYCLCQFCGPAISCHCITRPFHHLSPWWLCAAGMWSSWCC